MNSVCVVLKKRKNTDMFMYTQIDPISKTGFMSKISFKENIPFPRKVKCVQEKSKEYGCGFIGFGQEIGYFRLTMVEAFLIIGEVDEKIFNNRLWVLKYQNSITELSLLGQ